MADKTYIADKDTLDAVNEKVDVKVSTRAAADTALLKSVWTDQKAGFLDVAVSSRAPANTALSTAVWTNARAALLDALKTGVPISGTLAGKVIKSVQRGVIEIAVGETAGTATITAVNLGKSVVLHGGSIISYINGSTSNSGAWDAQLVLKSTTTVEAERAGNPSIAVSVPWQVLEFY